jgi:uncharacterized protein
MATTCRTVAAAGALVLGFSTVAVAETLEWTSGQIGGGWYTMSSGMARLIMDEHPDLTLRVVPGGGTANPSKVQQGTSQLAMGLDIFAKAAREGTGIYEGAPHDKLLMIGQSFSDNYMHLVRGEGQPYDFEQLFTGAEGVNLAVTEAGSSDEQTFRYVLEHYGTSYEDLRGTRGFKINHGNYAEMADQFKDGQVDYVFFTLGIPGAAAIDMVQGRSTELLPWPEELRQEFQERYGYSLRDFPADTYPEAQDGEVPTIIMATTLMVHEDVSEETVYQITKTLCENQDKLPAIHQSMEVFDCRTATENAPVPIHPGALRYYEEQGYL